MSKPKTLTNWLCETSSGEIVYVMWHDEGECGCVRVEPKSKKGTAMRMSENKLRVLRRAPLVRAVKKFDERTDRELVELLIEMRS